MATNSKHPETVVLHSGYRSDPATNAVAVPIYQTTSYQFRDTQHAANLFGLAELGNIYTRIMNPTNDVLEKRVAALEGGAAALAVASGQAASAFSIQNLARVGDNIVSSTDLYGGTWNLFANTMKTMGIECRFVDPADPENFRRATDARTRCYYAETLPNPKLTVFPIGEVAKIGRELGVPLIMDNTAAPVLCRPLDHGAAIVLHSTTKYIGGHGTSIGGILVDGGNFDWEKHKDRFPMLNTPDPSYHGAVWTQAVKPMGPIAYIIKARVTLLRDIGAPMSPFNAWVLLKGLETLSVRVRAQTETAAKIADALASHPKISRLIYPGRADHPQAALVKKQMRSGSTLIGFEVKGGKAGAFRCLNALKISRISNNLGDAKSLVTHPATTTHQRLKPEARAELGISEGFIRFSAGLEHADDLIEDLDAALEQV